MSLTQHRPPRRTLFLDRDGTVIVERHYLHDPEKVVLERGAAAALADFARRGYRLVMVTNQSGIARGLFTRAQMEAVNARVDALLADAGVRIDAWHVCPHKEGDGCACRKPATGMLDAAHAQEPVDWARSLIVGDKRSDIETGHARGVRGILVETGHGAANRDWARANGVPVVPTIGEISPAWDAILDARAHH
ncbi:D-glycero-alpha-D-manno-heptose-1,7-bisphosphate 7-phosphatase [Celeribacter sp.]|uniref:D-glycero-alpha-D-manno-heptose-1,7-bisphosphate 7-phosphatase n=1 Tax=Celeribacter sp. TaxID=1890673 RepID=UPI003A93C85A